MVLTPEASSEVKMRRSVYRPVLQVAQSVRKGSERRHTDHCPSNHLIFALIHKDGSVVAAYSDFLLVLHPERSCSSRFDLCSGHLQHLPTYDVAVSGDASEEEFRCVGLGEQKRETARGSWSLTGARLRELEAIREVLSSRPVANTTFSQHCDLFNHSSTNVPCFQSETVFNQPDRDFHSNQVYRGPPPPAVWISPATPTHISLSLFKRTLQALEECSRLWFSNILERRQHPQRIAEEALSLARQALHSLRGLSPKLQYEPSSGVVTIYSIHPNSRSGPTEVECSCCKSAPFAMSLRCGGSICSLRWAVSQPGHLAATATVEQHHLPQYGADRRSSPSYSARGGGLRHELRRVLKRVHQIRPTAELAKGHCRGAGAWLEPLFICLSFRLTALLESELSKHIRGKGEDPLFYNEAIGVPLIAGENAACETTQCQPSSQDPSTGQAALTGGLHSQGLRLEVFRVLKQLDQVYIQLRDRQLAHCTPQDESSSQRAHKAHVEGHSSPGIAGALPSHFPLPSTMFKKPLELWRNFPDAGCARQHSRASAEKICALCNAKRVDLTLPLLILQAFANRRDTGFSSLVPNLYGVPQWPFYVNTAASSAATATDTSASAFLTSISSANGDSIFEGCDASPQNKHYCDAFFFPAVHSLFLPFLGAAFFPEGLEYSMVLAVVSSSAAFPGGNGNQDTLFSSHNRSSSEGIFSSDASFLESERSPCIYTLRHLFDSSVSTWRSTVGDLSPESCREAVAFRPTCWAEVDSRGLSMRWRSLAVLHRDRRRKQLYPLFAAAELVFAWIERRSVTALLEGIFLLEAAVSVPLEPQSGSLESVLSEYAEVLEEVQPIVATEFAHVLHRDCFPSSCLETDCVPLETRLLCGVAQAAVQARNAAAAALRQILHRMAFKAPISEGDKMPLSTSVACSALKEVNCKYFASVIQESEGESLKSSTGNASNEQGVKTEWRVIRIYFPVFEKPLLDALNVLAKTAGVLVTSCVHPKQRSRVGYVKAEDRGSLSPGSRYLPVRTQENSMVASPTFESGTQCPHCPAPFALLCPPTFFVAYWKDERVLVSLRFALIHHMKPSCIKVEESVAASSSGRKYLWLSAAAQRHARLLEVLVPDTLQRVKSNRASSMVCSAANECNCEWQKKFALVLQAISVQCKRSGKWLLRCRGAGKVEAALLHVASLSAFSRVLVSAGRSTKDATNISEKMDCFRHIEAEETQHIALPVLSCLSKLKAWWRAVSEGECPDGSGFGVRKFAHPECGRSVGTV